MSENDELLQAIYDINCDISDADVQVEVDGYSNIALLLKTDGFTSRVFFLGEEIYINQDDMREWDEEKDDYSMSIERYLRCEMMSMYISLHEKMKALDSINKEIIEQIDVFKQKYVGNVELLMYTLINKGTDIL